MYDYWQGNLGVSGWGLPSSQLDFLRCDLISGSVHRSVTDAEILLSIYFVVPRRLRCHQWLRHALQAWHHLGLRDR